MSDWHERFWKKVDKQGKNDCWEWKAYRKPDGYAQFHLGQKWIYVHRFAYEDAYDQPIPPGMAVDHKCHNRACCNPYHLQVVTYRQNSENRQGCRGFSHIRDVFWVKSKSKWRVSVTHNYRQYSGGYFTDVHNAEKVAIALRNHLMANNLLDREKSES